MEIPYLFSNPNCFRFSPANDGMIYAASSDGTVSCTDLETGISSSLMNLNPDGWQVMIQVCLTEETNIYALCIRNMLFSICY